jgi:hypothetical protein
MTTMTGNLDLPGGDAPVPVEVRIRLAGAQGRPVLGTQISTGVEIAGELVLTVGDGIDVDGVWTATGLVGNADISPGGTTYRVERRVAGVVTHVTFHTVPTTGGPYAAYTLEDDPLGEITPSALSAHAATRGIGGHIPEGGVDGYVLTRDTDPGNAFGVLWTAGGGGGGGGVTSVNGDAGPDVDLSPGDLNPPAPLASDYTAHVALQGSAGAHLPAGGSEGQVATKGAGGAVTWATPAAGGGSAATTAAAFPVVIPWDSTLSRYVAPPGLAVLGITPANAASRIWWGPIPPVDATGGDEEFWEQGDMYVNTGS